MRNDSRRAACRVGLVLLVAAGATGAARAIDSANTDGFRSGAETMTLRDVALEDGRAVDLRLERFRVTTDRTRFVTGGAGGDTPLAFDPDEVSLYRGRVVGDEQSAVFLALRDGVVLGALRLGADDARFDLRPDADGRLVARPASAAAGIRPDVAVCGVGDDVGSAAVAVTGPLPGTVDTAVIELAIETDFEFFELHGDETAACAYVVQLFGAVSDIYLRDINARMELTYVRIWDTPADLFNEPDPLSPFRNFWNANMGFVQRDVAQFVSGRRDLPYGGVAYLNAVCGSAGYGVVGYVQGSFGDLDAPSVFSYDVVVTAHELGHNCGAQHTHSYGIDACNDLDGASRRGTIMSYCGQTRSGGNANTDLRFHTTVQNAMSSFIGSISCTITDCNGNGIDDLIDVATTTSDDVNGDSVPDECQDCNGNGTLDPADISGGASQDLNGNGVPDDCEPDCNGNGMPDDLDISMGTSTDLFGDGVPDECEGDCDGSGTSDYTEILADMTLDVDRDAVLDGCQDCDGDGTPDLVTLDGAWSCWVASRADGHVRGFHPLTGVLAVSTGLPVVNDGLDLLIDDAGMIHVSSGSDDRVALFDRDAAFIGDVVAAGSGGLDEPAGLAFGPDGNLFVASRGTDSVIEYQLPGGAVVGTFVAAGAGGLLRPFGLCFGPDGHLYVTSDDGAVKRYDGATGGFLGDFVSTGDNGGLTGPRGLAFKPDGDLVVASFGTNEVLGYDGATGAFIGKFNNGGTATALTLDGPWGIRIGPDGGVYVSRGLATGSQVSLSGGEHEDDESAEHGDPAGLHINSTRIYLFDADTGIFLRSYVTGNDTGLDLPSGFDFMPDLGVDCNRNLLQDGCDIAGGTSLDVNGNLLPDECECLSDVDTDGVIGVEDLLAVLAAWGACPPPCPEDTDGSGAVDSTDLLNVLAAWGNCTIGS